MKGSVEKRVVGKRRVLVTGAYVPFSKTLFRFTLTRGMVWPWALWMDMAHAKTRGI